jgi:acetyl-CoA carboxylase carboxyltransferase component/acetyl/propionyl-CoA carboxylase alpha subunit
VNEEEGSGIGLVILEREPLAWRVADAVAALGRRPALVRDSGPAPGIADRRVADGVVVAGDAWSPESAADLASALAEAGAEALWVGWAGIEQALAVREACAAAGVRVIGPSLDVVRVLSDPDSAAACAGLEPIRGPDDGWALEVATVADAKGTVLTLPPLDVTLRDRRVILAQTSEGDTERAARAVADGFRRALAERFGGEAAAGGITLRVVAAEDGLRLTDVMVAVPPWHAAAEIRGDLDAVALEVGVGLGESLPEGRTWPERSAVSCVLRAEDPLAGFRPTSGRVLAIRFAGGPGTRVDPAVTVRDEVAPQGGQGALIGVLTATGDDQQGARARLLATLEKDAVVLSGGATDRSALLRSLAPDRAAGGPEVALVDAAVALHADEERRRRDRFIASAARGRPEVHEDPAETFELRHGRNDYRLRVLHTGPTEYVVSVEGHTTVADIRPTGPFERRLTLPDGPRDVVEVHRDPHHVVEVDGVLHRVSHPAGSVVRAPGPAVVVDAPVARGDSVARGDPLVVLEAMKMEMTLTAPVAGVVRSVVGKNIQVGAGEPLVRLEVDEEPAPQGRRADFGMLTAAGAKPEPEWQRIAGNLRRMLLGYDVDPAVAGEFAAGWARATAALPPDDPGVVAAEEEALGIFADVGAVTATRRPTGPYADLLPAPSDPFPVYLRTLDAADPSLPASFVDDLARALARHGVRSLERSPELEAAVFRIARSHARSTVLGPALVAILDRRLANAERLREGDDPGAATRELLDRVAAAALGSHPAVADLAYEVRHRSFDQPLVESAFDRQYEAVQRALVGLVLGPEEDRAGHVRTLVDCPLPLRAVLIPSALAADEPVDGALLEALIRRYYRIRELREVRIERHDGRAVATAGYPYDRTTIHLVAVAGTLDDLPALAAAVGARVADLPPEGDLLTDYFLLTEEAASAGETERRLREALDAAMPARRVRRAVVTLSGPRRDLGAAREEHFTFRQPAAGAPFVEDTQYRGLHPMMGKRLDMWRLSEFDIERLPSVEDVYLFRAVARENPKDERLFCLTEVRDLTPIRDKAGKVTRLPHLERMFTEALAAIRLYQSHRPAGRRIQWNRILLHVRPVADLGSDELFGLIRRMAPLTEGLGLEKVLVRANLHDEATGEVRDRIMHISNPVGRGLTLRFDEPSDRPIKPLTPYWQKVVQARQRGLVYPYELLAMLAREGDPGPFPPGRFVEHDLDESESRLIPVDRPPGENTASIVAGLVTNVVPAYPEGMTRVVILGDPSRGLGSLAEAECRRICAALDLAEEMDVPLEWFAVSSGARISMESGTENMDWIGRVLRRLIEFTQAGGEVNVVVCGINVGAQPYWNAEATMLMHTRGILIMTPNGALVLTGKDALDYSGGVSADDNFGIGGYDRVMGPNGQAQYWAADIEQACRVLLRHYEHTYRMPGERFPRRVPTTDPVDRDVQSASHDGEGFETVGEIFSDRTNPERKRPFDIRSVMRAVVDADHDVLERWANMRDAETLVVWDAFLGGYPVAMLGIESRPVPRLVPADADGPRAWTSGTLFPLSSKKAARAINAASGNRPLVVLANLSGFDGSPESMRKLQLEYGAEIGRAVTNFRGPIVFLVVSRYHGGAFVVFSQTLNESLEVAAVEGSFASVIGGAPAAAVVFAREIATRVGADARIQELEERLRSASPEHRGNVRAELDELRAEVHADRLGDVAREFDAVHDIHRALKVGSVHAIVEPAAIRPYLIDAVERGIARDRAR